MPSPVATGLIVVAAEGSAWRGGGERSGGCDGGSDLQHQRERRTDRAVGDRTVGEAEPGVQPDAAGVHRCQRRCVELQREQSAGGPELQRDDAHDQRHADGFGHIDGDLQRQRRHGRHRRHDVHADCGGQHGAGGAERGHTVGRDRRGGVRDAAGVHGRELRHADLQREQSADGPELQRLDAGDQRHADGGGQLDGELQRERRPRRHGEHDVRVRDLGAGVEPAADRGQRDPRPVHAGGRVLQLRVPDQHVPGSGRRDAELHGDEIGRQRAADVAELQRGDADVQRHADGHVVDAELDDPGDGDGQPGPVGVRRLRAGEGHRGGQSVGRRR